MQNDDTIARRAERSRGALLARFPALGPDLCAPTTTRPLISDGAIIDLVSDGRRFHGADGRELVARQVAAFLNAPIRFVQELPGRGAERVDLESRMLDALLAECGRLGLEHGDLIGAPPRDVGVLIVLGLGLGLHLPPLIRGTGARRVIVAEADPELLRQSLGALDWTALLDDLERRGGGLDLIVAPAAADLADGVGRAIRRAGTPFLDGGMIFQHYDSAELEEAGKLVIEAARLALPVPGAYEKALASIGRAVANLSAVPFRPLDGASRPTRHEPVIVVGSGPSLDAGIEHVRRLRDGAIVISCGSALRVCRAHGIVPDYHCEAGTVPWCFDLLSEVEHRFGLGDATLVAPATVDPRMAPLFKRALFHFDDDTVTGRLFAPDAPPFGPAGPGAANLGVALAAALGFKTLYLFGIDCGSRLPDRTHARESAFEKFEVLKRVDQARAMDVRVPGTFGGTVVADVTLDAARRALGRQIAGWGLTVFNCSNGAWIDATRPRHGTDVSFAITRLDHARVRREAEATLPALDAGAFLAARDFAPARVAAATRFEELITATARTRTEGADLFTLWDRVSPLLDRPDAGVAAIAEAPARQLITQAAHLLNRIPDAERRTTVLRHFLEIFGGLLSEMRSDTLKLLDALALPGRP